jgi:hypothetical protein
MGGGLGAGCYGLRAGHAVSGKVGLIGYANVLRFSLEKYLPSSAHLCCWQRRHVIRSFILRKVGYLRREYGISVSIGHERQLAV